MYVILFRAGDNPQWSLYDRDGVLHELDMARYWAKAAREQYPTYEFTVWHVEQLDDDEQQEVR